MVALARRYAEVVDVLRSDEAPARFVWRGRHYTVRSVLARWITTGSWWTAAVEPDTAGVVGRLETVPIPASPKWAQRAWGEPAPDVGAAASIAAVDDDEREFWRVEASPDRPGGSGITVVVELCFAWSSGRWTIAAVMD